MKSFILLMVIALTFRKRKGTLYKVWMNNNFAGIAVLEPFERNVSDFIKGVLKN